MQRKMPAIVVEEINVQDVIEFDKERFNSNNHWENDLIPSDYREVLSQSEAKHWIDHFKSYHTITISPSEFPWLIKAANIGQITNKFPAMYEDELENLLTTHDIAHLFNPAPEKGYFVRTNTVSLKYGCHGVGPYFNLKDIIESAVTCIHGHTPIHPGMTSLEFYLMDWVILNPDQEFRMFVCDNRVTAISQQYTTRRNQVLLETGSGTLEERHQRASDWARRLLVYWEHAIRPIITHTSRYTIDIALLDAPLLSPSSENNNTNNTSNDVFFIEINCFGKEYAAGSSLFHWLRDEDVLYGRRHLLSKTEEVDSDTVYMRYAV